MAKVKSQVDILKGDLAKAKKVTAAKADKAKAAKNDLKAAKAAEKKIKDAIKAAKGK